MSGPIVRKYGFPNFEKIFGERAAQHGADENPTTPEGTDPKAPAAPQNPGKPIDPNAPEAAGKVAGSTELGSAVE